MSKKVLLDQEYSTSDGRSTRTRYMSLSELAQARKEYLEMRENYILELLRIMKIQDFYLRELGTGWMHYLIQTTYEWELIFNKEIELRANRIPTEERPSYLVIPRKFLSKRRIGFVGNKMYTVVPSSSNSKIICAEFN